MKAVVGPPPADTQPGNAVPAARERAAVAAAQGDRAAMTPVETALAPVSGFSDYVLAAGVFAAQAFYALKFWKRRIES